ncbi:hypothetical protein BGZ76_010013 [Entomortierella beljakovae]|nr:hypothetical protein BGZ76_010013 [Entomortierella beljakovae]
MSKEFRSILLLKEAPEAPESPECITSINSHQENDPYMTAFQLIEDDIPTTIEYIPPFTVIFPESTLLSNAIKAGYPRTPYSQHQHLSILKVIKESCPESDNKDCIWAFAITSQNSVRAVEKALQMQSDLGATLKSIAKIGFKYINCRTVPPTNTEISTSSPLSFDNSAQLVDFLASMEWPKSNDNSDGTVESLPTLWFLAGEMRMKTISEKLTEHGKPFREVEVYRTGPRPEFEDDLYNRLKSSNEGSSSKTIMERVKKTMWLVGFSPRGVDMTIPGLVKFLREAEDDQKNRTHEPPPNTQTEIRWATIGATTGKRIQEHLDHIATQQQHLTLHSNVAVAKAPKPNALAEAILLKDLIY